MFNVVVKTCDKCGGSIKVLESVPPVSTLWVNGIAVMLLIHSPPISN